MCVSSYKGQKVSTPVYSKAVLLFKGGEMLKCKSVLDRKERACAARCLRRLPHCQPR